MANGSRLLGVVLPTTLAFVACQGLAVQPLPLRGEVPRTIAIWPFPQSATGADRELVFTGLVQALGARGYRVVSPAVSTQLLLEADLGPSASPTSVGPVLGADAVLQVVVHDLQASGRPLQQATWDCEWRLLSCRDGGVTWSFVHRGTWRQAAQDFGDPHRPPDAEPDIVPIGGRGDRRFHDAAELVASLHRMAMAKLPPAGP